MPNPKVNGCGPHTVARFAVEHRDELSGLSFKGATKHIRDLVG